MPPDVHRPVEDNDFLEPGGSVEEAPHLVVLVLAADKDDGDLRVIDDVLGLPGRVCRVNGDGDAADGKRREIGDGEAGLVRREDGGGPALRKAQFQQPLSRVENPLAHLTEGQLPPGAVLFPAKGGLVGVSVDRLVDHHGQMVLHKALLGCLRTGRPVMEGDRSRRGL